MSLRFPLAFFRRTPAYWTVIAPFRESVDFQATPQSVQRQFERLPEPIAILLAADNLFTQVRDGGFAQFFWNPVGVIAPDAQQAFAEIGLPRSAEVIAEAMRLIADPYPRVCEARQRIMQGIWDRTADSALLRESLHQQSKVFYGTLGRWSLRKFARSANAYSRRHPVTEAGA